MDLNAPREVFIITTGGTIEKTYDEEEGSLSNRRSIVEEEIIDRLRLPYLKVETLCIFNKDSLYLTDQDRQKIYETINSALSKRVPIIVIHGTDTMAMSAEFCYKEFLKNKIILTVPIIFTGAMRPLEFSDSDAIQNVNEALMASGIAAPGVYISFHCRLFSVPNVRKNPKLRTFESLK
ncbi:MAG: asparaginase domain-containing protein [Bacteriovoracaceae bacterium]